MATNWPVGHFRDVMQPLSRPVPVEANGTYRTLGVQWYAKGLFVREEKPGHEIRAKELYRVEAGDFVYNRLFAWKGSFGIVGLDTAGGFVSGEFPCFKIDTRIANPRFLHYYLSQEWVWKEIERASTGQTSISRLRFKEPDFLEMELPVPPLPEQQRIVVSMEALARRVEEARRLRHGVNDQIAHIISNVELQIWPEKNLLNAPPLSDVTTHLARGRQSKQGESSRHLIKTQHVQMDRYVHSTLTLDPEAAEKVAPESQVRPGDILICCSAAGCLGRVAQYSDTDLTASTDTHVAIARPNTSIVLPSYLYAYLRGAQGQHQLRSRERGDWKREKVGFRLTELNLSDLQAVPVPLPSIDEQHRTLATLGRFREKASQVIRLQNETGKELGALMPSILAKAFAGELYTKASRTIRDTQVE